MFNLGKSRIQLGKMLVKDIRFAKFVKVFQCQNSYNTVYTIYTVKWVLLMVLKIDKLANNCSWHSFDEMVCYSIVYTGYNY